MKRSFLFTLFSLFVLLSAAQKKPNVVFILADDLGYGDLGCYGQELISTPNLDKLAKDGIRFTQYYAGTSVCAPSRAAVMTGLHTGHTPVRGNYEIEPEGQYPLPDSSYTMAEMFQKAGYTTGLFGKWGLGYPGSEGDPNKQGFDQFFGYNCQRQSHNFFPGHLWDNNKRVELKNTLINQQQYAPGLIQAKALEFMSVYKEKPFFMYLAYTLPHAGLQLPNGDQDFEAYKQKFKETPQATPATWNGIGYQPQAYPRAAYAAMVTKLDRYVGEVIQKLKALGIDKNTLIVFTSDNGPHREGGNMPEFFNSNGGFKGIKRELYEGGIREPMIVSWPAVIKKGRRSDHIGASWDLFPTFAQLVGQPAPANTDGISILPLLSGTGKQRQHQFLYWEFHEDSGRQAVRLGNWKGVRLNVKKDKDGPIQLFDLATDPKESKDISAQHTGIVKEIARIMKEQHVENEAFPLMKEKKDSVAKNWKLIFQDEFNTNGSFDSSKWVYCERQHPAWNKYITQSPDYAWLDGGNLVLKMDNKIIAGDNVPYHSGGIKTLGKFNFTYGKVEVRAKFKQGRGSWPAIWMMPEKATYGSWPNSGEIDIMEHVNNETVVHQTIHNASATDASGGSKATKSTTYNTSDYNVYGIVWTKDKIEFYINNALKYTYSKPANATSREWPFDKPFYLILNQSGGAGWPGPITNEDLPFIMQVDWVRVYKEM